jgi:uncharacterized protein (DUF2062 family)
MGVALGLFIAWTPALGFHIFLVLGLAVLLRANKFVALVFIWVNNPFTLIAIYYPNYLLGRTIMRTFNCEAELSSAQTQEMFSRLDSSVPFTGIFSGRFWQNLFGLLWQKGPELWLGSILLGLLVASAGYFITYHLIHWYRRTHPHRRFSMRT